LLEEDFDTRNFGKIEREGGGGGLGDLETGSEKIMSEMLGFDLDDQDECDLTTEEDLIFLKDPSDKLDIIVRPFIH